MKIFNKCWKAGISLFVCTGLLSVPVLAADLPTRTEPADDPAQQVLEEDFPVDLSAEIKEEEEEVSAGIEGTKAVSETEKQTDVKPGTVVKSGDCGFTYGTLFYEVTALGNDEFKLRIYGTGKMLSIGATYGAPWHKYADGIVSIELEDGIESIAQYAFTDCDRVTSITIPASVTTMYTKSFQMKGLKSVYFLGSYGEKMKADAFDRTEDLKIYYDQSDPSWVGTSFNNATMQADDISLEEIAAVEAACTTDGNIHYYYNKTWDRFFSDAEGKLEIRDKDSVVIPALGHIWDDGVVTKDPTDTEDGVKTYTCSRCEEQKYEAVPALGKGETPDEDTPEEDIPDEDIPNEGSQEAGGIVDEIIITQDAAGTDHSGSSQNGKEQEVKTSAGQVRTADENPYVLYLILLLLSGLMIARTLRKRFLR